MQEQPVLPELERLVVVQEVPAIQELLVLQEQPVPQELVLLVAAQEVPVIQALLVLQEQQVLQELEPQQVEQVQLVLQV